MATGTGKSYCVICGKGKATLKCGGCLQDFCYNHVADHRQELNKQLDEVEVDRDVFRQTLTDQTTDSKKHPLIKQIDKWERDSINKIQQTAEEARQVVLQHTIKYTAQIEIRLNKLTDELREGHQDNDFFETDLKQWKEELRRLTEELTTPSNIKLQQGSTSLVNRIRINVTSKTLRPTTVGTNIKWRQNGITVAGGNGKGNRLNQLFGPHSIYVDDDRTMYIADRSNDRIVEWKSGVLNGQVIAGGNGKGDRIDQLNYPTDIIVDKESDSLIICDQQNRRVMRWPRQNGTNGQIIIPDIDCSRLTMDDDGYLYVSDTKKHEVRRFKTGDTRGTIVAGGNGEGNRLDQLNYPTHLFVDHEYSVYVSDLYNHRVMKWLKGAKEGIVVAGDQGRGDGLAQLSDPRGLIVDHMGTVYVTDYYNHRVMRWCKGAAQGAVVVGGNEEGEQGNQFSGPKDLSFDQQGNLYVVDWGNDRVQRFDIDSSSTF